MVRTRLVLVHELFGRAIRGARPCERLVADVTAWCALVLVESRGCLALGPLTEVTCAADLQLKDLQTLRLISSRVQRFSEWPADFRD